MPRYMTGSNKRDPYRNFNFQIFLDSSNLPVAACKKMSKLAATVDVVKFRSGSSLYATTELSPGRISYEPVTLEAGLTQDKTFQAWATQLMVNEYMGTNGDVRAVEPLFRREITIVVLDIDCLTPVRKYLLHQAWVSRYTASSDLIADANDIIIESIQIEHEGFARTDLLS